jgi:trehalose 6-phosphate synthase
LEVRLDRERSSVFHHNGVETLVRPFPISTDFAGLSLQVTGEQVRYEARRFRERYALHNRLICVGVDRIDYTKGIPERLHALDRLFTKYPQYRRHVVFLQAGPESRIHLNRYKELNEEVSRLVEEINWRHGDDDWVPIILLREHLSLPLVLALYALAEVCIVSSLHDGMNLVAKEYVAARSDGNGVLVLSRFTGAARELQQALLINPYDTEDFCDTLVRALEMDLGERRTRMGALRETVANNNIYRWAGKVLSTLFTLQDSRCLTQEKDEGNGILLAPIMNNLGALEN